MFNIVFGLFQSLIVLIILHKVFLKKQFSYNFIVLLVYYAIFTFPLILDTFIGIASYSTRSQFIYEISSYDTVTNLAFNLINMFVFIVLFYYKKEFQISFMFKGNFYLKLLLVLISILPLVLLIIYIDKIPSFKYASLIGLSKTNDEIYGLYKLFLNTTIISVLSGMVYLIITPKRHIYISWVVYLSIFVGLYMNGKRLVVFLFFALLIFKFYLHYKNKILTIGISIVSIGIILIFNSLYSSYLESSYQLDKFGENEYLQFRIDYSRDHNVKMAIYKELHSGEKRILEYRGQSFLYNIAFFIPREKWQNKPYPYGVYVTSASLGLFSAENLGWQMTTSLLDESIANFGIVLGLICFLSIVFLVIKFGNKFKDDILVFSLTSFVLLLFLTMQFSFSSMFIVPWVVLILIKSKRRKKLLVN
ncbi:oligosaccharide repeat unit polymerase [Cohnella algarum]|uniref:oligosaccharide repeat unit polymerase n=1 Tax=Cohnella algarum TaxID=2044859 RepID=UPI001966F259|nr:oligosaccharide repeat unit polymerase [Cohnella algarum]MBN2980651.1 oligosaccharide repeat unit polymerase [Cohnella algarum]